MIPYWLTVYYLYVIYLVDKLVIPNYLKTNESVCKNDFKIEETNSNQLKTNQTKSLTSVKL